ncbi:HAD family phosphatase [Candidatus Roizmanbacteria bacterium]|nr:HAD family phosphatase [Candidatus Roizmanbacteria bacterium]
MNVIKPKGMLFDMDGVITILTNNMRAWRIAFRAKAGIEMADDDWYRLEGMSPQEISEKILINNNHVVTPELVKEIADLKQLIFNNISAKKKVELYPFVQEMLTFLKRHNVKVGLVTGSVLERVKGSLSKEVLEMFDAIVTADEVRQRKPSPDPFLRGASLLGLTTGECWAVENAPLGVISARKAGCFCVALMTTLRDKSKLSNVGANVIFDSHKDLLDHFRQTFK